MVPSSLLRSHFLRKQQTLIRSSSNASKEIPLGCFPARYLRDASPHNFDPSTHQRTDVKYDPKDGKPESGLKDESKYEIKSVKRSGDDYVVDWGDGVSCSYTPGWISDQKVRWSSRRFDVWDNLTEQYVRESSNMSIEFDRIIDGDHYKALESIYGYGILLVTNTPTNDDGAGVAALASAISGGSKPGHATTSLLTNYKQGAKDIVLAHGTDGPMRTLYGSVWFTTTANQSEGTSVADSAYSQDSLPLHTDMTYMQHPPGLQIFTMVKPALSGGESTYADGFTAANILKEEDSDAFDVLTSAIRAYKCRDNETGWHLQAHGPIIDVRNGHVVRIRHNDLDRLPDLPPRDEADIEHFYRTLDRAGEKWDEILRRDSIRLTIKLQPGDTMVVANQRCMHGRHKFVTSLNDPRTVMGCYVNQDELDSRLRMEGFAIP